jgi:hypothetical protein
MNAFLPISVNPQAVPNAIGRGEAATEPLAQVSKDQSSTSGQTFSPVFAQVLREQDESPTLLNNLQAVASPDSQDAAPLQPGSAQKDLRNLEIVGSSNTIENALPESNAYGIQVHTPSNVAALPATDSDPLADSARLLSTKVVDRHVGATTESIPDHTQKILFEQAPLPVAIPTVALAPLQGTQGSTHGFLAGPAFQATSGGAIHGKVRPALDIDGNYSGNLQASVPKVFETGPVSQQVPAQKVPEVGGALQHVPQGPEGKLDSSVLKQEDVQGTSRIAPSAKEIPSGLPQVNRFIQEDESLKLPVLPRPTNSPIGSQNLRPNNVLPVTAVQPEAPAGFSQALSTGPLAIKPTPGILSVVQDVSNPVIGHRTAVPVDLLGESGLLGKGDRAQAMVEASVKSAGLDVSGGQGLGSGMNHFQNPQSGFQQPSTPFGQGVGLRGLEERGPEFPAPALQRLQMDVQLSESQRVSIDVGVQNRQVYAGLVTDHSVLRNLANQFVPQLENQLADIDMELKEFSAQVREERDQKDDTLFNDSRYQKTQKSERGSQAELSSPSNFQNGHQEHGLHLVA